MKKLLYTLVVAFSLQISSATAVSEKAFLELRTQLEVITVIYDVFDEEAYIYSLENVNFTVEAIEVQELEEEVNLGFNPVNYLPEGFNPLKGKNDINWNKIELIELEEEINLGFNTKDYLPKDFNALEGKNDLDWSRIKIIEIEEEVDLGFDPKKYLPKDFNPYVGMKCKTEKVVVLN